MNTPRHFLIRRRSHFFVGAAACGADVAKSPAPGRAAPAGPPAASAGVIVTCISFSASSKVCGVTTEPAPYPSETGNPARKFRRNGATCAFRTNCLAIDSGRR
jgi:hypothetical protein